MSNPTGSVASTAAFKVTTVSQTTCNIFLIFCRECFPCCVISEMCVQIRGWKLLGTLEGSDCRNLWTAVELVFNTSLRVFSSSLAFGPSFKLGSSSLKYLSILSQLSGSNCSMSLARNSSNSKRGLCEVRARALPGTGLSG